ncbi:hypothetical protein TcasGA2_TC034649 [Tribolium castaneum]|uniref:Uncharacterized protein n=1 Tax=Tribolium castaneum TaxID=7070 RepID=A0A139WJ23_TRICA|nr:hypothetical protein TcasGA2_TC034649 [Tribolium castaneum]
MRHIRGTSRTGQIAPEQVPAAYGPSGTRSEHFLTNRETITAPREAQLAFLIPTRADIDTMIAMDGPSVNRFLPRRVSTTLDVFRVPILPMKRAQTTQELLRFSRNSSFIPFQEQFFCQ